MRNGDHRILPWVDTSSPYERAARLQVPAGEKRSSRERQRRTRLTQSLTRIRAGRLVFGRAEARTQIFLAWPAPDQDRKAERCADDNQTPGRDRTGNANAGDEKHRRRRREIF